MNTDYNIDEIIMKYADNIFGFCVNRLNNIDDAKDLSQDILLEIIRSLPKSSVADINAWIWKIAHNRYAMRINSKKRYITVSLDDGSIKDIIAEDTELLEEDNSDEANAVFAAVHSLAKTHREILVDCYVYGLSYSAIAEKHKLSVNTVKTRLFYGKQKLKERWHTIMNGNEKIYEKLNWALACNGSDIDAGQYLNRQICRAITRAAYEKPLTISEISAATGIPCMYIEDEIPNLLDGEALIEENGKYLTNFIIHSIDFLEKVAALRKRTITETDLSNKVVGILNKYDAQIRNIGFVGNDRPKNELWWLLVPLVIREAAGKKRSLSGLNCPPPIPRYDGGYGWMFAAEVDENHTWSENIGAGCHSFDRAKNKVQYYTFHKYYSNDINRYFGRTLDIDKSISGTPDIDENSISDVEMAEGIKYNLIKKTANGWKWSVMFFTSEQIKELETLIIEMANEISDFSDKLSKALLEVYEMYRKSTPKHLFDQINGIIGGNLQGSESVVCYELEENGVLMKPDGEYFTKSILVIRK